MLSDPVQLALDWGTVSLWILVLSVGRLSYGQLCKEEKDRHKSVTVGLDELWNSPESSIFVYFRCDQRPQL